MKDDRNRPLISIVTVVLNDAAGIGRTMESVRRQGYQNTEHIIIDGGSTDGTVDIIRQAEGGSCSWLSEPDSGIYAAMNKGLARARGRLIGTINSGDSYAPEAVAHLLEAFGGSPDCDVFHGNVCLVSRHDDYREILYPDLDYRRLPARMTLNHPGSFISREAYSKYGTYNENYRIAGDFELFSRFYLRGAKFKYLDRTMAFMTDGGISDVRARESALECRAVRDANGISGLRTRLILANDAFLISLRSLLLALKLRPAVRAWRRARNSRTNSRNRRFWSQ